MFTEDEIDLLKQENSSLGQTTYEIFKALDTMTRACEHTRVVYVNESEEIQEQYDSENQLSGIVWHKAINNDGTGWAKLNTYFEGKRHGWEDEVEYNESVNALEMINEKRWYTEMRDDVRDGLHTYFFDDIYYINEYNKRYCNDEECDPVDDAKYWSLMDV